MMKKILTVICVIVMASFSFGQNGDLESPEIVNADSIFIQKETFLNKLGHALTPVVLQWQYAGNIGMHSIGAEWNVVNNVFKFGLALGYVPDSRSIEPLFVGTVQFKYTPNVKIRVTEDVVVKPLNFTLNFSSTYGERFSIYNDNEYYPDNYYWWNVRTRYGLSHDLEVLYSFDSRFAKGISFYFNTSTWDVEFYSVFGNDNLELDRIPYKRLFTFGLGTKIYLN